ncbi:hypothetical protein ABES02_14395 [Neobacillus pocheonensis]|uniref:hypothetical protein n=1 Tax=Neobacillus pocheonensis TaxID=363869 RepID=UPI003D29D8B7
MLKLLVFVLIAITLILLSVFIDGLMELQKQELEEKKNIIREGIEGYLDRTFGFGTVKIFKSLLDAEGNLGYLVYLPHYEWFKSPQYKWYEVFATQKGFQHDEVER